MTVIKWRKDPLRETLKQDILKGKITPEMSNLEAAGTRPTYEKMGLKLFGPRLKGMRKSIANDKKKKPKPPKWVKKNPARRQMRLDVSEEVIKPDTSYEVAQSFRALYKDMDKDLFKSRLDSMRNIVTKKKEEAAKDSAALKQDRIARPRPEFDHNGQLLWVDHEARDLLEDDIDDKALDVMSPRALWVSRVAYQDFPFETFYGHVKQELQTRKWRNQWVDGKKHYAVVPQPGLYESADDDDEDNNEDEDDNEKEDDDE